MPELLWVAKQIRAVYCVSRLLNGFGMETFTGTGHMYGWNEISVWPSYDDSWCWFQLGERAYVRAGG